MNFKNFLLSLLVCSSVSFADVCMDAREVVKRAEFENIDSQKNLYLTAIKMCPTLLEAHYNLGIYYYEKKDYESAIKSFNDALKISKNSLVLVALGKVYFEKNDLEKAQSYYKDAISQDSKNVQARQGLALCKWKEGEISASINILKEVLKIDENNFIALYNLGQLEENNKNLLEAKEYYKRSIEKNDMFYKSYKRLGLILYTEKNYNDAKNYLHSCVSLEQNDAECYFVLSKIYEIEKDDEKALLNLKHATELDRNNKSFAFSFVSLLIKGNHQERAKDFLLENEKLLVSDYRYYSLLGVSLMELGKYSEANDAFKKSLKINPLSSQTYNNLGVLYKRLLNPEEAKKYFKKALSIDENNNEARKNLENL